MKYVMKYVYIGVTEWCGLWRVTTDHALGASSAELIFEGHSLSVPMLAEFTDQDGDFELEAIAAEGTKADSAVTNSGSFKSDPLAQWVLLAKERG